MFSHFWPSVFCFARRLGVCLSLNKRYRYGCPLIHSPPFDALLRYKLIHTRTRQCARIAARIFKYFPMVAGFEPSPRTPSRAEKWPLSAPLFPSAFLCVAQRDGQSRKRNETKTVKSDDFGVCAPLLLASKLSSSSTSSAPVAIIASLLLVRVRRVPGNSTRNKIFACNFNDEARNLEIEMYRNQKKRERAAKRIEAQRGERRAPADSAERERRGK